MRTASVRCRSVAWSTFDVSVQSGRFGLCLPAESVVCALQSTAQSMLEHVMASMVHESRPYPRRLAGCSITGSGVVVRLGNGSFAFIGRDGLTGSTGFAVLRPYESNDREVVWCAATSRDNIDRLAHLADGGAYPAVRPRAVTGTLAASADLPVRRAFSSMTTLWIERIEHNRRECHALATMRDALLPKLVSGELQVENAAGFLEGVS